MKININENKILEETLKLEKENINKINWDLNCDICSILIENLSAKNNVDAINKKKEYKNYYTQQQNNSEQINQLKNINKKLEKENYLHKIIKWILLLIFTPISMLIWSLKYPKSDLFCDNNHNNHNNYYPKNEIRKKRIIIYFITLTIWIILISFLITIIILNIKNK